MSGELGERVLFSAQWKADRLNQGIQKTTQVFEQLNGRMKTLTRVSETVDRHGRALSRSVNQTTQVFRKFSMELLGVLFFGMAVAQVFQAMLTPALQAVGLFDLFGQTLQILFLPIALVLLDAFLPIMQFFMDLPEPLQMVIGGFAIFGLILGKLAFLVGVFGLGLEALVTLFSAGGVLAGVGPWFTALWASIAGAFTTILLPLFVVVAALAIGFWLAWKDNFGKIREWTQLIFEGIKNIFGGIFQFFQGWWLIIKGLFTGNSDMVIDGFKKMGIGIWNAIKGAFQFILGLAVTLGLSFIKFGIELGEHIVTGIITAIKAGKDLFLAALKKIFSLGEILRALGGGGGGGGGSGSTTGSRQTGGLIPHDGLYKMHRGESVGQANTTNSINFAPTINFSLQGPMNGFQTMDRIKYEFNQLMRSEFDRLARR
jgi:hypothetical protein